MGGTVVTARQASEEEDVDVDRKAGGGAAGAGRAGAGGPASSLPPLPLPKGLVESTDATVVYTPINSDVPVRVGECKGSSKGLVQ